MQARSDRRSTRLARLAQEIKADIPDAWLYEDGNLSDRGRPRLTLYETSSTTRRLGSSHRPAASSRWSTACS